MELRCGEGIGRTFAAKPFRLIRQVVISIVFDDQHGVRDAPRRIRFELPLPLAETYLPLPGAFLGKPAFRAALIFS